MDRQHAVNAIEVGGGAFLMVLTVVAIISAVKSRIHGPGAKALWVALVLVIPLAGAVLWFFIGRETPQERTRRLTVIAVG